LWERTVKDSLSITVAPAPPSCPAAREILWAYFYELITRYQRRPGRTEEVEAAMLEYPSDDLVAPTGVFLLARRDDIAVGCIGLRLRPNRVGQVTRMFVLPSQRRRGIGTRLLGELEAVARKHEISRLELDTRDDLVEARRLYERYGFDEVLAFNAAPYAEHWFTKQLDS
jgi:GNAT superfamily N-acetyltransferase